RSRAQLHRGEPGDTGGAEPGRVRCAASGADGAVLLLRLFSLLSVCAFLSLLRLSLPVLLRGALRTIPTLRARETRRTSVLHLTRLPGGRTYEKLLAVLTVSQPRLIIWR